MKTNKMMRLASVLLVAVLLSTCAISGTFAKYVTEATGTDSARVAKFGVVITANGSTFASVYETDDPVVKGVIANSVYSSTKSDGVNLDDVIAPGTDGEMVAMTISGIPEVAVEVKYVADLELSDNWYPNGDGTVYCPIVITVDGVKYHCEAGSDDADDKYGDGTIATFEAKVEAAINDYTAEYPPQTDLSVESTVKTPDVSWEWAFSTSVENDVKDTWLGDRAAEGNFATIELTVTTTVTQID